MKIYKSKKIFASLLIIAGILSTITACQPKESKKVIIIDASSDEKKGKSYQTLTDAIDYVNQNPPASEEERIILQLSKGTYREHTTLTAPYVTFTSEENPEDVVITFYYGAGNTYASMPGEEISISTSGSTVISETAHDFIAENITFENSYNLYTTEEEKSDYDTTNEYTVEERSEDPALKKFQTQACCIKIEADRSIFKNCRFIGRQDTIYMTQMPRCFFKNCFIEGTADYICGGSTAWFQNCTLNCPYNAGYVSASASGSNNPYGYMFKDCTITKECNVEGHEPPQDGDFTLGRPWRCTPTVIYWNCKMDSHIVTGEDRFVNMVAEYSRVDCTIIECNSMDIEGNPLNMEEVAASYETILTDGEMKERYSLEKFFAAQYNLNNESFEDADNWIPQEQ